MRRITAGRWVSLAIVIGLGALEIAVMLRTSRFGIGKLELELTSSCAGTVQVYYDRGADFSEQDSQTVMVGRGANRATVWVNAGPLKRFRVDLPTCAARFSLRKIVASGPWRHVTLAPRDLSERLLAQHSVSAELRPKGLAIASQGEDPYLVFRAVGGITENFSRSFWLRVLVVVLLSVLLIETVYRYSRRTDLSGRLWRRLQRVADWLSDPDLTIHTPATVLVFLIVVTAALVLTALKVHYSSIAIWDSYVPQIGTNSVLFGDALGVRSDEWRNMPAVLSPHYEWTVSTLLQPLRWGFLFGPEYGVAWTWNGTNAFILLANFSLLLHLTRGAVWLSTIGALWFFLSAYVQWWGGMRALADIALLIVGGSYALLGTRRRHVIGGCLALVWGLNASVSPPYPPWQVPLGQWAVLVFIALLTAKGTRARLAAVWKIKLCLGVLGLLGGGVAGWFLWQQMAEMYALVTSTVYPGERLSEGGQGSALWLFSGFYDTFLSERRFPIRLGNACEAASFILVFPLTAVVVVIRSVRMQRVPIVVKVTLLHIGLMLWWMLGPVSASVAKWTLMDRVPSFRTVASIGSEGIVAAIVLMAAAQGARTFDGKWRRVWVGLTVAVVAGAVAVYGRELGVLDPAYYTNTVLIAGLGMMGLFATALLGESQALLGAAVLVATGPNLLTHPINHGFAPVTEKAIVKAVRELGEQYPKSKWIVFGTPVPPKILSAGGVDVFNNRDYPDMKEMAALDPDGRHRQVWNRYSAFRNVWELPEGADPEFSTWSPDAWGMGISPLSPLLQAIGVDFVVFEHPPSWELLNELKLAAPGPINGFWIFHSQRSQPGAHPAGSPVTASICGSLLLDKTTEPEGTIHARIEVPFGTVVDDATIAQAGVWQRCLFGGPVARRVGMPKSSDVLAVSCPYKKRGGDPELEIVFPGQRTLHIGPGSTCGARAP